MSDTRRYQVRAVYCDHRADDETVYAALTRATAPLGAAWAKLQQAKRIAIKFNQDKAPPQRVYYAGQRQQLVSDSVARAVLRLLRERTHAEIVCADVSYYTMYSGRTLEETTTLAPILREFDIPYINGIAPPHVVVDVPGGGRMFRRYTMVQGVIEADALVSVAKIKNHAYMGITGCLKNLFGLMPGRHPARPRHYYHHLVRMPYMLADIGRVLNPALNIVDALVGQAGQEWGDDASLARVVNGLVAGDHVIATDACLAHLMGHDPTADWLTPPFHRDRNALLVAAEGGFGTVDLAAIDWQSELAPQPPGTFFAKMTDSPEMVARWRRDMCEQALYYRDHPAEFAPYRGEYILLQDGVVQWHDPQGKLETSRRVLAGANPDRAMWLKFVDPEETEGEHYEVYERTLAEITAR